MEPDLLGYEREQKRLQAMGQVAKGAGKMVKGMFYDPIAHLAELEKWKAYNNGEGGVYYMDPQGKMYSEQDYQKEVSRRTLAVAMLGMGANVTPGMASKAAAAAPALERAALTPALEAPAASQAPRLATPAVRGNVNPIGQRGPIPTPGPEVPRIGAQQQPQLSGPPAVEVTTPTRAEAQYWSSRFGRNMPIQDANVVEAAATPPPQLAAPRVRGNVNPIGSQGPIPLLGTVAEQAMPWWKKVAGAIGLGGLAAGTAGYFSGQQQPAVPGQQPPTTQPPVQPAAQQVTPSAQQPAPVGEMPSTKGKSAPKGKGRGAMGAGVGTGGAATGAASAPSAGAATAAMPTPTATPNIPMDASGRPNYNYYSEMLNSADANNAYYRDFVNLREQARMAAIEAGNRGESYRFVPIRDVKSNRVYFVNANGNDIALDMNDKQDRERFNKIVEQSGVDPIKMSEWMSRSSRPLMRHMMPGGGYQEAAPDFNFNRQRAQESVDTQGNKLQFGTPTVNAGVAQMPVASKPATPPTTTMPEPTAQPPMAGTKQFDWSQFGLENPTPAAQQPAATGSTFDWAKQQAPAGSVVKETSMKYRSRMPGRSR